jgi:dihydropteroate synthase
MAVERGAHVVRTHDVAETRDAAIVGERFARGRASDRGAGVEELDVTTQREVQRHLDRIGSVADPGAGVARAFEFADLERPERVALGELATDYPGVTVAVGEDAGLLLGTVATLRGVVDNAPPALADRLAAVEDALPG